MKARSFWKWVAGFETHALLVSHDVPPLVCHSPFPCQAFPAVMRKWTQLQNALLMTARTRDGRCPFYPVSFCLSAVAFAEGGRPNGEGVPRVLCFHPVLKFPGMRSARVLFSSVWTPCLWCGRGNDRGKFWPSRKFRCHLQCYDFISQCPGCAEKMHFFFPPNVFKMAGLH